MNATNLTTTMTTAAQAVLAGSWANIQIFVVPELKSMAEQIVAIETGGFSPALAKNMLEEQKKALKDVLIGVAEIELTLAQNAINAVLKAVQQTVNTALNFPLIAV